jgi:hypothetical protein
MSLDGRRECGGEHAQTYASPSAGIALAPCLPLVIRPLCMDNDDNFLFYGMVAKDYYEHSGSILIFMS